MTDEDRKRIAARIDQEFPHQVLLPLMIDADTEEDLIWWLDRRIGRWDMYVDLNQRFVRYCFHEEKGRGGVPAAVRRRDGESRELTHVPQEHAAHVMRGGNRFCDKDMRT